MAPPAARMSADMREQPAVLHALLGRAGEIHRTVRSAAGSCGPRGILLLGRGTSFNAAIYALYAFQRAQRRPVSLLAPSLLTRYESMPDVGGWLAVALSQSGRTPEIVDAVARLRAGGAATLAITNETASPLADAAEHLVALGAGRERAIPATKTFVAQLAVLALAAEALGLPASRPPRRARLVDAAAAALEGQAEAIEIAAVRLAEAATIVGLGRGPALAIARETALKVAETSGIPAFACSSSEYQHGHIAAAGSGVGAIAVTTDRATAPDTTAVLARLAHSGAIAVSIGEPALATADRLPVAGQDLPAHLRPILHAIVGQRLAQGLAIAVGRDPDHPAGLSKVTATT